jgi:hypothetical protein
MKKAILFLIFVLSIAPLAEADTKCFRATENRKVIKQEGECARWTNGLRQLSVTFRCRLFFHAAAFCWGSVPQ